MSDSESEHLTETEKHQRCIASSYMVFCAEMRPRLRTEHPEWEGKEVLQELGNRWRAMTPEERAPYAARERAPKRQKRLTQKEKEALGAKAAEGKWIKVTNLAVAYTAYFSSPKSFCDFTKVRQIPRVASVPLSVVRQWCYGEPSGHLKIELVEPGNDPTKLADDTKLPAKWTMEYDPCQKKFRCFKGMSLPRWYA
jgi:hypothetical protein